MDGNPVGLHRNREIRQVLSQVKLEQATGPQALTE